MRPKLLSFSKRVAPAAFALMGALQGVSVGACAHADVTLSTDRPGHVYSTDENVRVSVSGVANGESLRVELRDSPGRRTTPRTATVTAGMADLGRVDPGWYHVTARGAGGAEAALDIAAARPRSKAEFRESSPFGVASPPHVAPEWDLQGDMGAAWLQWSMPWAYMEARSGFFWYMPGANKYGDPEGIVRDANRRGMRTVLQLRSTPLWANPGKIGSYPTDERTMFYPPDDAHWDEFERFLGVLIERFKPLGVHHYEVWSEAEGSLFKRWDTPRFPKVEAYQKMLSRSRKVLREKDPDALLLGPGDEPVSFLEAAERGYTAGEKFSGKPDPFAGRRLDGIGKTVDVVTGHFYWTDWQSAPRRIHPPEAKNPGRADYTLPEMISDAKRLAAGRPVWITEVGYASAKSGESPDQMWATEDEQASLLVRYYLMALASGVKKIFWYTWKDTATTSYGLLRTDGTVKPAYIAYRTMTERLEGLTFDRLLDSGPDRWLARFMGPKTVLVAWKTTPGESAIKLSVPWKRVRVTSRDGMVTEVVAAGGKASINLPNGEPVYLDEP